MTSQEELLALIETYLGELALTPELGELAEPVRYALAGGGKRIRPLLCLATGEAAGREPVELLPAAAALELVHSFSLVHDDLPALAEAVQREVAEVLERMCGLEARRVDVSVEELV